MFFQKKNTEHNIFFSDLIYNVSCFYRQLQLDIKGTNLVSFIREEIAKKLLQFVSL